ncbi:MAG: hypothetical protein ACTHK4_04390 [Mycobacteriales bacterium]
MTYDTSAPAWMPPQPVRVHRPRSLPLAILWCAAGFGIAWLMTVIGFAVSLSGLPPAVCLWSSVGGVAATMYFAARQSGAYLVAAMCGTALACFAAVVWFLYSFATEWTF